MATEMMRRVGAECAVAMPADMPARAKKIAETISKIDTSKLLPCESSSEVGKHRLRLEKELAGLRVAEKSGCPLLDPAFFGWKNALGWPVFALFDVHSSAPDLVLTNSSNPTGYLAGYAWVRKALSGHVFRFAMKCLAVVLGGLTTFITLAVTVHGAWCLGCIPFGIGGIVMFVAAVENEWSATLSAKFVGIIPSAVREKIRDKGRFFDRTLLLAEIPGWKPSIEFEQRDPLVLGYSQGNYFLIDEFDATPAEDYIKQEFSA